MKLARAIHFDESDQRIFASPARTGEWCISGGFEFSDWTEGDLTGKARQAFAHGWLGLESFGRASVVAVAPITEAEKQALTERLAGYFVSSWGAPDIDAAWPVAVEEIRHMAELCAEQAANTLAVIERELTGAGVKERFRLIPPQGASLEAFAVHGD